MSARSTTRSIPGASGPRASSRREEHEIVHGRSEHEAPLGRERIVDAVEQDARHLLGCIGGSQRGHGFVSAVISARLRRRFRSFTAESAAVAMVTPHNVAIVMAQPRFGAIAPPNRGGGSESVPERTPFAMTSRSNESQTATFNAVRYDASSEIAMTCT